MPHRSPVLGLLTLLTCLGAATLAVPPPATARARVVPPPVILTPAPVVLALVPAVVAPAPVVIVVPQPRRQHVHRWHRWHRW